MSRALSGRMLAIGAPIAYLAALAITIAGQGVPLEHDGVFFWLGLGMAAFSISAWRRWGLLLIEWLPFLGLLIAYDYVRGAVSVAPEHAHVSTQLAVDKALFFGHVPTVWLQEHLYSYGHVRVLDVATWCVYLTHFFAVWITAALLWRLAHDRFRRFAVLVVLVTLAGLLTYWLFPAQPPWMASQFAETGQVTRIVPEVWGHLGLPVGRSLFVNGNVVNEVAAMPSMHAAYPMVLLLFFWSAGVWVRLALGFYTLAMAFALVYGGEHFVTDILAGWIYALVAFGLLAVIRRRRRSRVDLDGPVVVPHAGVQDRERVESLAPAISD